MLQKVALIGVAGVAFLWATRHWQRAIMAAMVLLVFEGALRKWLFPGSQQMLYFAKDVIFLGAYFGFARHRDLIRRLLPPLPQTVTAVLAFAAFLGVVQVFNPRLPSLLIGIFGFKAYFFYTPLMFLVPLAFRSLTDLEKFLHRYVRLSIPVGMIAFLQFLSPSTSTLNTYARENIDPNTIVTFGTSDRVRTTGTFSFITGYTAFLMTETILTLLLLSRTGWDFKRNRLLFLCLVTNLIGMLTTGSRATIALLVALAPFYWWLTVVREGKGRSTAPRLILAAAVVVALVLGVGSQAVTAFKGRASGSSDFGERVSLPLVAPINAFSGAGILGYGIGATHQIAAVVHPTLVPYSWLNGLQVEAESGRVMVELGLIGFCLIYLSRISLIAFSWRRAKGLRHLAHRSIAGAAFLFLLGNLPAGNVFDVTTSVYYWFFAGLVVLAVRFDRDAIRAAAKAAAAAAAGASNRPWVPAAGSEVA